MRRSAGSTLTGMMNVGRRAKRGTSLVEGIVMIPVLLALMAACFWCYRLHRARLEATLVARESVASRSLAGCVDRAPASAVETKTSRVALLPDATDFSLVDRHVPSAPGLAPLRAASADREARVTRFVDGSALVDGLATDVASSITLPCNERPVDGDARAMTRAAANSFDPRSP